MLNQTPKEFGQIKNLLIPHTEANDVEGTSKF
jgi:hypothetical protein